MNAPADVLVLGSGGAGLAAALAAAGQGAAVTVLERAGRVGGTTAVSGGGVWMPGARALAGGNDAELMADYLCTLAGPRGDRSRITDYLAEGPAVLDRIERASPLRWQHAHYTDYHTDVPGGDVDGHCVEAALMDGRDILGDRLDDVRSTPFFPAAFTLAEVQAGGGMAGFWSGVDRAEVRRRRSAGLVAMGRGLAAGLYAGCLAAGVSFRTGIRAVEPLLDGGHVTGVQCADGAEMHAGAVVVATGGFEWDDRAQAAWLGSPLLAAASPPYNTGDGIRLGRLAGGAVANTAEAWWYPVLALPGEEWPEGAPLHRLTFGERTNPHSIMVNASGKRFCNESASYHVVGRAMTAPFPTGYGFANAPAWVVLDSQHRRRYRIQTVGPGDPNPPWLTADPDLTSLAGVCGLPADQLTSTVERFNRDATRGEDPDFGRGSSLHDRFIGDRAADHPCLGTVAEPPFYAIRVLPGTIGTKGGLVVDPRGRVLDATDRPVRGLYAGSNAIANVTGAGYPGAGGTLGPAIVSGWQAGIGATTSP